MYNKNYIYYIKIKNEWRKYMKKMLTKKLGMFLPIVLVVSMIVSLFAVNASVSDAGPGFSDGAPGIIATDLSKVAEYFETVVDIDEDIREVILDILDELGDDLDVGDLIAGIVGALAEEEDLAEYAVAIVAIILAETDANIFEAIAGVTAAIVAVSDLSAAEVLGAILESIPDFILAMSIDMVTKEGVKFEIPLGVLFETLVSQGSVDFLFSAAYADEVSYAQEAAGGAGKVGSVVNLNFSVGGKAVSGIFSKAVTVSLPAGKNNSAAYFDAAAGAIKVLPSKVVNGFLYFKTLHFSQFVLMEASAEDVVPFDSEPALVAFTDIADTWYEDIAIYMGAKGFIPGIGKATEKFEGTTPLTTEELLATIMNAYGIAIDPDADDNFDDVDEDSIYAEYIATAKKLGIAKGVGDNNFGVGEINRERMFVFLYRILDEIGAAPKAVEDSLSLEDFEDAGDISDWALEEIEALLAAGLINGVDVGVFAPQLGSQRAFMARLIYSLLEG